MLLPNAIVLFVRVLVVAERNVSRVATEVCFIVPLSL